MLNPGRNRRAFGMVCAAAALGLIVPRVLAATPQYGQGRMAAFTHAERMREALEGRPESQRTRLQYQRVLEAYRAIYHSDPASPRADASIAAVADLLAEEGRVFQDAKALRDAIGQYEFLRHEYPASRFRFSALLTEGEIYQRDFGDLPQAKAIYLNYLRLYPESPLTEEARTELRNIRHLQVAGRGLPPARAQAANASGAATGTGSGRHSTASTQPTPPRSSASTQVAPNTPSLTPQHAPASKATTPAAENERAQENDVPSLLPPTEVGPPSKMGRRATEPPAEKTAAADLNTPPPPSRNALPLITGIRHWSTPVYTRVAIDLQQEVRYTAARVPNPDRIYFDMYGARLSPELIGRSLEVTDDGFLSSIRVLQYGGNTVRIVLDVNSVSDYSAFFLSNPSRLIIDVHGQRFASPTMQIAQKTTIRAGIGVGSTVAQPPAASSTSSAPPRSAAPPAATRTGVFRNADPSDAPPPNMSETDIPRATATSHSALSDVATLSNQPDQVRATKRPTTAPIVASVATPATSMPPAPSSTTATSTSRRNTRTAKPPPVRATDDVPPATAGAPGVPAAPEPAPPADNTAAGRVPSSMMRALGLKINRIVIDAGHGGHDSGTLGPGGIEEKDVVLDVALRLGKLLKQRLGADVIYTRSDDTFIPLETRTAIANQAQADLFISVHANSSPDTSARGIEVYYLSFTSSADALEVAARENAVSNESIHQLSDLVKKIALSDKINESRAFAEDVDESLYAGLDEGNPGLKDRGVKKAPFVVLIGANMPSILAEISFLTNPNDAQELRQPEYRERIAESLYRGVSRYVASMNGLRVAQASSKTGSSE
jgi:N-acetylmuramoyl-L-alanine amidase